VNGSRTASDPHGDRGGHPEGLVAEQDRRVVDGDLSLTDDGRCIRVDMDSGPARVVRSRFEIEENGRVAYLQFDTDDHRWMTIWHTEVPPELRGHGVALELVKTAFEYARDNQLRVDVIFPLAASLAAKYPEYQALIGKKNKQKP